MSEFQAGPAQHVTGSADEHRAARLALLAKEKELNRARDELAAERRRLPWVQVTKDYEFEGPEGRLTMRDLFDGRRQLIVYHFMYGPDWEEGCPSCSSAGSDFNFDYGVSFTPEQREAGGEYNYRQSDVGDELPGLSVFAMDEAGQIFHTYSAYSRGLDPINSGYQLLDLTPKGRDEDDLPWTMAWLRRHDSY